jgi:hypothetical protein
MNTTIEAVPVSRPTWVWIISIFYLMSGVGLLYSYALVFSGKVPFTAAQADYFRHMTTFDYVFAATQNVLLYSAAVFLFLMRKPAAYLFLLCLLLSIPGAFLVIRKGFFGLYGGLGLFGTILGYAISIAICVYAWRLLKRGALR